MKSIIKLMFFIMIGLLIFPLEVLSQPPAHAKNKKEKKIKQKQLPYGLQKKLQRTGQLPPGWQKKINQGEVVSSDVLNKGVILRPPYWENHPYSKDSEIYKVQEKIFRVDKATKEILDVFK